MLAPSSSRSSSDEAAWRGLLVQGSTQHRSPTARAVCEACTPVARLPFDPIAEARRQWRAHWGPAAVPSMAAVTSIMRAEQILIARLNELLRTWRLTFPRYEGLMLLYYSRNGSLPLGKMGARSCWWGSGGCCGRGGSHSPVTRV